MATTSLNPYITFSGNCREAMSFYNECLDGKLQIMNFADSPMDVPEDQKGKVMHATLTKGDITLMASDSMPGQVIVSGSNIALSINCTSQAEADRFFNNLSKEGKINMPMQETFWGAYFGMLTDKFQINWMFNYDIPK